MNTWSLSWHGLKTVVDLEIRQRVKSRRWLWALIAWFVFIGLITGLVMWSIYRSYAYSVCSDPYTPCSVADSPAGPIAFSAIVMFVLGMGLVVAPAFTATSINGDRSQGTLATLQATRLSSVEIVAGKLVVAWLTAAAFLVVASPFIIASMVLGGISVWQVLVCLAVIFVLVAVVCAIGLGWSSIFSRSAASTVMTYLSIITLAIISPLVLLMSAPFLEQSQTVEVWGLTDTQWAEYVDAVDNFWAENPDGDPTNSPLPPVDQCQWHTEARMYTRVDKAWWLLIPNPFVIVADAAPLSQSAKNGDSEDFLSMIRFAVRQAAQPPASQVDDCTRLYDWNPAFRVVSRQDGTLVVVTQDGTPVNVPASPVGPRTPSSEIAVWYWGLGVNLLLGGVFFFVAVRRLRIPYGKLVKGTRVA